VERGAYAWPVKLHNFGEERRVRATATEVSLYRLPCPFGKSGVVGSLWENWSEGKPLASFELYGLTGGGDRKRSCSNSSSSPVLMLSEHTTPVQYTASRGAERGEQDCKLVRNFVIAQLANLAKGDTPYGLPQAAGRRLTSKGKMNLFPCSLWSSHGVPSEVLACFVTSPILCFRRERREAYFCSSFERGKYRGR
jgi:hypothetical protein